MNFNSQLEAFLSKPISIIRKAFEKFTHETLCDCHSKKDGAVSRQCIGSRFSSENCGLKLNFTNLFNNNDCNSVFKHKINKHLLNAVAIIVIG